MNPRRTPHAVLILFAALAALWLISGPAAAQTTFQPVGGGSAPSVSYAPAPSLAITVTGAPRGAAVATLVYPPRVAVITASGATAARTWPGAWTDGFPVWHETDGITGITLTGLAGVHGDCIAEDFSNLTQLSYPALKCVTGGWGTANCAALATITAPVLEQVGYPLSFYNSPSVTTLSFPALRVITAFNAAHMTALATINLPAAEHILGEIHTDSSDPNLATINLGPLKSCAGDIFIGGAKLNQASVDGILARLAALDGTGGTIAYAAPRVIAISDGTSAAPSFTGTTKTASITATGGTATATCAAHGYATGDLVTISGTSDSALDGVHAITVTGSGAYTFASASTATGATATVKRTANHADGFYSVQRLRLRGVAVTTN